MKTEFKDLTPIVKIGVIGGWVALLIYGLAFLFGLVQGMLA